jgi:YbbR domain-containing protein
MASLLRSLGKSLPTLVFAFILSVAVWISAVTAADPNVENVLSRPIPIEIVGQDPGLILSGDIARQVSITLKAPRTVWDRLNNENGLIKALVDLSGLKAGNHRVEVQIQIQEGLRPIQVLNKVPSSLNLTFETLSTRTFPLELRLSGDPAIGYQVGNPEFSQDSVSVSGPEPLVNKVKKIRMELNLSQVHETVRQALSLQAVDESDLPVEDLTLTPDKITISLPVTQLGGYRNVVIKVSVIGQVSNGFRVTNISVYPPAVTVFSNDPRLVDELPGYIETNAVNLNGARDNQDMVVSLKLPEGISIVGKQTVNVQVGVAAIEGSITLNNMRVQTIGLQPGVVGKVSPEKVDVILSGPLYLLDQLSFSQVHVILDLTNLSPGTYQLAPRVDIDLQNLRVESILPGTIEVVIGQPTPTPTTTLTPTPTQTSTPTSTSTPPRRP